MKRTLAALLGVAALALSQVSFAQAQDMGWYVGASFGQSKFKQFCSDTAGPGADCDDKDTAIRILGGYQLNRMLAAEIGYSQLGKAKASVPGASVENKASVFELVGLAGIPIGNAFSVYGKGGVYHGELKGTFTSTAFGSSEEKATNTAFTFGAGVRFDFMRNLALRAEYQRYQGLGDNVSTGQTDIEVLSLGVLWKF
jgi:OOP family OmpA-OmpF porin